MSMNLLALVHDVCLSRVRAHACGTVHCGVLRAFLVLEVLLTRGVDDVFWQGLGAVREDVEALETRRQEAREEERRSMQEEALEARRLREQLMSQTLKLKHLESQSKLEVEQEARERDKARDERDRESVQVKRLNDKLREAEAAASAMMQRYKRILSAWATRQTSSVSLSASFGAWKHRLRLRRCAVGTHGHHGMSLFACCVYVCVHVCGWTRSGMGDGCIWFPARVCVPVCDVYAACIRCTCTHLVTRALGYMQLC